MKSETTGKTYRSDVAAAVHEMIEDFHQAGLVDRQTLREFDHSCIVQAEPISSEDIKALRQREQVSQPVFARYLNVSRNLVSDWERGVKRPGGPALRLLGMVRKNGLRSIA